MLWHAVMLFSSCSLLLLHRSLFSTSHSLSFTSRSLTYWEVCNSMLPTFRVHGTKRRTRIVHIRVTLPPKRAYWLCSSCARFRLPQGTYCVFEDHLKPGRVVFQASLWRDIPILLFVSLTSRIFQYQDYICENTFVDASKSRGCVVSRSVIVWVCLACSQFVWNKKVTRTQYQWKSDSLGG